MSGLIHTISSTTGVFVLAPVLLSLCTLLLPFAFLTTSIAFVALIVRAALIQGQVAAALLRHWLGIDDETTSTSAWIPKTARTELDNDSIQRITRDKSIINKHSQTASIDFKGQSLATENLHIKLDRQSSKEFALIPTTSGTVTPASPTTSRPGSTHSSYMARDYEGIGGWYALPGDSATKPEASSSLEWLHMNARLELPDADASFLTRPRTPEERNRSSSIGGRSHRSAVSLHHRHHQRSTTAGSIGCDPLGDIDFVEARRSRKGDSHGRSQSGALSQSGQNLPDMAGFVGGKIGESKHKSMISLSEKGSRFAYKLAGWKPLSLKKKSKNASMNSPGDSTGEESRHQSGSKGLIRQSDSDKQPNSIHEGTGGTNTPGDSASGSVEGVETGNDLTMWMSP